MDQVKILLEAVDVAKRSDFESYIKSLCKNDRCFGIDQSFLSFIDDYYYLSQILNQHIIKSVNLNRIIIPGNNFTVFDIGCATALQHVFFSKCTKYVGIDFSIPKPKFFAENSEYIDGKFSDLMKNGLEILEDAFGIVNMSLLQKIRLTFDKNKQKYVPFKKK